MIEQAYLNALMAAAAYADWSAGELDIRRELVNNRGFTEAQLSELFFDDNSTFLRRAYVNEANGFSATLFEERATGKLTVAFRGTEFPSVDIVTDLLAVLGNPDLPLEEFFNQGNSIDDFLAEQGLAAYGELLQAVDFTGHSLGGYLALMAGYKYSAGVGDVFTYNGLGLSPIESAWEDIGSIFNGRPIDESRVHNYYADKGWEVTASPAFSRPGGQQRLFVEGDPLPASIENHRISKLVESLSVYRVLGTLAPDLDTAAGYETIYAILDAASNLPDQSLETVIDMLGDLLGGELAEASVKADVGLFYQVAAASGRPYVIDSLAHDSVTADTIYGNAAADTEAGRGYRYALVNLSPFVVVSGPGATAADDGAYDLENYSTEFLARRAEFLDLLLERNRRDLPSSASVIESARNPFTVFTDLASGTEIRTFDLAPEAARVIFGTGMDDRAGLRGGPLQDHLFGGGGDDILEGLGGSDLLDGGAGSDLITGGRGDDLLLGGTGADTFAWNSGDGDDLIADFDDGGDRIVVNGVDLATLQFERISSGSPYYAARSYPGITLYYDGAVLAIDVGSGPDAGSITATGFAPDADYGIVLGEPALAEPVTDFTVTGLGSAENAVADSAYDRQWPAMQGGLDWAGIGLRFNAADVQGYTAGSLHGTLGGVFEGGPVGDYLSGGDGANALHGLAGNDRIDGGAGDDFLEGGAGSDVLSGGEGNDLIFGTARAGLAASLDPGVLRDQFYLAQLSSQPTDINILDGGAGDDHISGGEYGDYIDGGPGFNYLLGGTGRDFISGGAEREIIYGDSALHYRYEEVAPGVAGERLEIAFAGGEDAVRQYDDVIHAGAGDDSVWGELGDDEIYGDAGDDILVGDRYSDPAYFAAELPAYGDTTPALDAALHGDDRLYGGAGSDLLLGLGGDDLLAGGSGADTLLGGAGDDTYVFAPGDGLDRIDDSEGSHNLLFRGIPPGELQVLFQGDQVFVGSDYGAEGFYLAKSEWANVRIAVDTPDASIERSRLDTLYLDPAGNLLLKVNGSSAMTEAARDALFTIDTTDPGKPRIAVAAGVDEVAIEAGAGGGATMRIVGGGLQVILDLAALQIATGLDFLSLADGVPLSLVGLSGEVFGTNGRDRLVGGDSADSLHGGPGDDSLEGRAGNDRLYGDSGRDMLQGGRGDDFLEGGPGPDSYLFDAGDGRDVLSDIDGYHYLVFGAGVAPGSVALYYSGAGEDQFRIEYGQGDAVVSQGTTSSHWINGVTVNGVDIPLVQRSDLADGTFRDTRWNDVFEPGGGTDTIHVSGWGNDVFRFAGGDGADTIRVDNGYYPEVMGEIRLAADVDLQAISFDFRNGDAVITYGPADQLTLDTDTVYSFRDNVFGRFTLVSEADPGWIPVIRAEGYVGNLYGSYGADQIVGNANIETILPGYGDDIIDAGDGPDRIVLNDLYLAGATGGIGHKDIRGGGDNDTVQAPLHQGLTFRYARGDGHDTIEYDWSCSGDHPYRILVDTDQNSVSFEGHGQDTLVFGPGIALSDLQFLRLGEALQVSLTDGSGSIRINDFFHAYDADPSAWDGDVSELFGPDNGGLDSLLHPAILAAMPRTPIAALVFADGTEVGMDAVLAAFLEVSAATVMGTEGSDELYGTDIDDVVEALGGDDYIEDMGGSNIILAGAGNDQVLVASDSDIDPGPGDDVVNMVAGNHVIRFGPGSGHDFALLDVAAGSAVIAMSDGLGIGDMAVSLVEMDWGPVPLLTLVATGDSILLAGIRYDAGLDQWDADTDNPPVAVQFDDGTVVTGRELYALAAAAVGDTITGTAESDVLTGSEGNDVLVGGRGDDIMDGAGGDDIFLVEGRRQGRDRITGGAGFDTISGGSGDDRITLTEFLVADSVERVDGGPGFNTITGTGAGNALDFSATELLYIAEIDGRGGRDVITGSAGDDVLIGGAGRDTLSGGAGDDTYLFRMGDGRDVIDNADADPGSLDTLRMDDVDFEQVWLSRKRNHLVMNIAGTTDRVLVRNWYAGEENQLDAIAAGDYVLMRDQVDQLVNAMAAFDVPEGVGVIVPEQARTSLEPVLASVWQLAG